MVVVRFWGGISTFSVDLEVFKVTLVKSVMLSDFSILDVDWVMLTIVPITITVRIMKMQREQASALSRILHSSKGCLMCVSLRW